MYVFLLENNELSIPAGHPENVAVTSAPAPVGHDPKVSIFAKRKNAEALWVHEQLTQQDVSGAILFENEMGAASLAVHTLQGQEEFWFSVMIEIESVFRNPLLLTSPQILVPLSVCPSTRVCYSDLTAWRTRNLLRATSRHGTKQERKDEYLQGLHVVVPCLKDKAAHPLPFLPTSLIVSREGSNLA